MTTKHDSTTAERPQQAAIVREPVQMVRLDPQALIDKALVEKADVEVMNGLFDLAKRVQDEIARRAWFQSMSEAQAEFPKVVKTKTADTGKYRFTYAPLSEITDAIMPVLSANGLTVTYKTEQTPTHVTARCVISHALGHGEETNPITIPIDTATPGPTPAQRVGIALQYAKRYSLLAATGVAPVDEDGPPPPRPSSVSQPRPTQGEAHGQPGDSRPPQDGFHSGIVTGVETQTGTAKSGKNAGKPYTKFVVSLADGTKYSTFDASLAEEARDYIDSKVEVEYKTGQYGRDLVTIGPVDDEPDA